jgi:hypothetical protein
VVISDDVDKLPRLMFPMIRRLKAQSEMAEIGSKGNDLFNGCFKNGGAHVITLKNIDLKDGAL